MHVLTCTAILCTSKVIVMCTYCRDASYDVLKNNQLRSWSKKRIPAAKGFIFVGCCLATKVFLEVNKLLATEGVWVIRSQGRLMMIGSHGPTK